GEERAFVADGTDRFRGKDGYFAGERLQVVRRADGSISHLEVVTFVLTKVPYDSTAPIPGGPPTEPLSLSEQRSDPAPGGAPVRTPD
ncbi:MAG: DUF7586 domain-containing protein, partial [Nocardioidaceae bacterium]